MLETILSWFASLIGNLFESIVNLFLDSITTNLSEIPRLFPGLVIGYRVFQSIGIGLVVCIAAVQLIKFFGGSLAESRDTPVQILLRSAIAGGLLYFGGNILSLVIEISRIPFTALADMNAVHTNGFTGFWSNLCNGLAAADWMDVATEFASPVILAIELITICLIGWNLLKLMLEVCERYLMIIVLTYVSPLVFATYTSKSTSHIFQKYCSMFFGQAILLTLSVWMLKLIMSGFITVDGGDGFVFKMVLILAMCKIAQRTDTYMQELGIGVATTGENLLDDVVVAARTMGKIGRGGSDDNGNGGSKNDVLGAGANGGLSRFGGLFGGAITATRRAAQGFRSGQDISEITGSFGKNFKDGTGWFDQGIGDNLRGAAASASAGDQASAKKGFKDAAKGIAMAAAVSTDPTGTIRRRQAAKASGFAQETTRRALGGSRTFNDKAQEPRYQNPRGGNPTSVGTLEGASDEVRKMQKDSGLTAQQFMEYSAAKNGLGGFDPQAPADGVGLDMNAQAAGLSLQAVTDSGEFYPASEWQSENGDAAPFVSGPDDRVGDFVASNYAEAADSINAQAAMVSTAEHMSEMAAEQALFNPNTDLSGNDEVGDKLIKKAFGEQQITGQEGGQFKNITATTGPDGGRVITCDYVAPEDIGKPDAKVRHFEMMDQTSLESSGISMATRAKEGAKHQMTTVESAATGQKVFRRETTVQQEKVDVGAQRQTERTETVKETVHTTERTQTPPQGPPSGTSRSAAEKAGSGRFFRRRTEVEKGEISVEPGKSDKNKGGRASDKGKKK